MTTDPRIAALAEALTAIQAPDPPGDMSWWFEGTLDDYAAAILAALPPSFFAAGLPADATASRGANGACLDCGAGGNGHYRWCDTANPCGHEAEIARLRKIEEAARAVERVMRQYASLFGGGIGRDERTVLTALDALRAALGADLRGDEPDNTAGGHEHWGEDR